MSESIPKIEISVTDGLGRRTVVAVDRLPFEVGSDPRANLVIDQSEIPPWHFRFALANGKVFVEHMAIGKPIRVDGAIAKVIELKGENHRISAGLAVLSVRIMRGEANSHGAASNSASRQAETIMEAPPSEPFISMPSVSVAGLASKKRQEAMLNPSYFFGKDEPGESEKETWFTPVQSPGTRECRFTETARDRFHNPLGAFYAIIDAAQSLDLVYSARQWGAKPASLFIGDRAWEFWEVAPYFAVIPRNSPFLEEWNKRAGSNAGLLFDSVLSPREFFGHMRLAFDRKSKSGEFEFFRFYDPRVFRKLCSKDRPPKMLGRFFEPIPFSIVDDERSGFMGYQHLGGGMLSKSRLGEIRVSVK